MRYEEMVRQFLAARAGCSREWAISDSLVMCVELDLSVDPLRRITSGSQRSQKPSFLRVTLFRFIDVGMVASWGPGDPEPPWEGDEAARLAEHRSDIEAWASGRLDSLPASTSTKVSMWLGRS